LSVIYDDEHAIENISFSIEAGDSVAIIGPNGAGKSTLMKAIMGLVQPVRGAVVRVDPARLGYVPQHQSVDWSFPVTVCDVVMMGLVRQIGWLRFPTGKHWEQVRFALDRVGMLAFQHRQIGDLSGGQRQRVFIARALAQQADILLLDEPFAGIDIAAEGELLQILDGLNRDGLTVLLSTHNLNMAFKRFQRVLALNRTLIGIGTPQEMYTPETLSALYGGAIAMVHDGNQVAVFIDENAQCC
jgi:ABC-type Mn2+/Zn2+ transport system ATPase subunit